MAGVRRPLTALAVLAALLVGLLVTAAPAAAHSSDPRVVTVLEQVAPDLPEQVVVQVQPGIASQLVASNPTAVPLEVLGAGGRPFLRLSSAGVEADLGTLEFFTTSSPTGAAPPGRDDGPERWVRISTGDSWGWYDHRLHPEDLRAPADQQRPATLGDFEVPLRYGEEQVTASGRIEFQPLLGSHTVSADPAPGGLTVQALPGRLPGLFLSAPAGTTVEVEGRDGEPYLRVTDAGVEVNEASRTHVEDRQARGQQAGPPRPEPAFRLVAPGTRTWTWLDARLRPPSELPPQDVLRAGGPTVVREWEVPVVVGGTPAALTGDVTWVPEADAAARVRSAAAPVAEGPGLLPYALGGGAVLVLAGAVLGLRRAQARRPAAVQHHTKRG
jgi:hypothetical protein